MYSYGSLRHHNSPSHFSGSKNYHCYNVLSIVFDCFFFTGYYALLFFYVIFQHLYFSIVAQAYEILLQCISGLPPEEQFLKVIGS